MDLHLDNPRKFILVLGIGLMTSAMLAIVYLFERWSATQWTLIEKVSSYELAPTPMTPKQESFIASCVSLSQTVTHSFEIGLVIACTGLLAGVVFFGIGCALWRMERSKTIRQASS